MIGVVGISHHTAPLELRERMAIAPERLPLALQRLRRQYPQGGAAIVSTCNRVEVYIRAAEEADDVIEGAQSFLAAWHDVAPADFVPHSYAYVERDAVRHLFRVASSLDSLVVGEGQILGQVHEAYETAHAHKATEKILSGLFQRAFKAAKEVRSTTNIGAGRVSVASVAVDLAASIFGDLSNKTVLIVGSGKIGALTLRNLVEHGAPRVLVANRSQDSARALAAEFCGEALTMDAALRRLHEADVVVSTSGAAEPILRAADFQRALRLRAQAPVFAIDLAVPRDIDPASNELDNVYVYTIDDLRETAAENAEARHGEIARCEQIVDRHVDQFMRWRHSLFAEPTIVSMSREWHGIRERELERTLAQLSDLSEKERDAVEYLTKRIVNKILQRPLEQLKREVQDDDPKRILHLVKRLFGLEETT